MCGGVENVRRDVGKTLVYGMSVEGVEGMLECEGRWGEM